MTIASEQQRIESVMRQFSREDRWECIQLYSADGLLMAAHGESPVYNPDKLLEFSFSLIETVRLLEPDTRVKEIVIRGMQNRKLVFHFFNALDETMILAAVLHTRKGYRRAMDNVIRMIREIV